MNLVYNNYSATEEREGQVELEPPDMYSYPLEEEIGPEENCYYRLDFPTIDSLLLIYPPDGTPPILLMFQITWSGRDAKVDDLRRIDGLQLPSNVRKYYVAVTPEGIHRLPTSGALGKILCRDLYLRLESPDVVFPIFDYPVPESELFPS